RRRCDPERAGRLQPRILDRGSAVRAGGRVVSDRRSANVPRRVTNDAAAGGRAAKLTVVVAVWPAAGFVVRHVAPDVGTRAVDVGEAVLGCELTGIDRLLIPSRAIRIGGQRGDGASDVSW